MLNYSMSSALTQQYYLSQYGYNYMQVKHLGLDKQNFWTLNCNYFLTKQFKHVFWVLKRTVSLRRFFWLPTTYGLVEK